MSSDTIWGRMQGHWLQGSVQPGLSPKWINEKAVYVFRDRSLPVAEAGSPRALAYEQGSLVTGFLLGVAASYLANALYFKRRRR